MDKMTSLSVANAKKLTGAEGNARQANQPPRRRALAMKAQGPSRRIANQGSVPHSSYRMTGIFFYMENFAVGGLGAARWKIVKDSDSTFNIVFSILGDK